MDLSGTRCVSPLLIRALSIGVRAKLKQHADGDRQFVKVLGAVLDHGLAPGEAACAEAREAGIASGDVILRGLGRRRQPATPPRITTSDALRLNTLPTDCWCRLDCSTNIGQWRR